MKKKILVSALCVVGVFALGGGIYITWLLTPPPMPKTPDDVATLLISDRFARLSNDRKQAYGPAITGILSEMSDEERRAMRDQYGDREELRDAQRQMFQIMIVQRARDFAKADEETRNQILDNMIDRMNQWRGNRNQSNSGNAGEANTERQQQRDNRRNRMTENLQEGASTGNPQNQQLIGEFFKSLRERRTQRGL